MFSIVKFIESNTVEVVPSSWVDGGVCLWPNYKPDRINRAVKRLEEPDKTTWINFDAAVLRQFNTYHHARTCLPAAELTSDLGSDVEHNGLGRKQRKIVRLKKLQFESDSEKEDTRQVNDADALWELPVPPLPPSIDGSDTDSSQTVMKPHNSGEEDENVASIIQLSQQIPSDDTGIIYTINELGQLTSNSQNLVFEKKVLEILGKLTSTMSQLNLKVDKILENQGRRRNLNTSFHMDSKLPLKSVLDVNSFNQLIKSQPAQREAFVEEIRLAGGGTCKIATKCAINKIMTKEVAVLYSAVGGKGKLRFFDLEFRKAIFDALRSRRELVDVNEKSVSEEITKYLPKISDSLKYHQKKTQRLSHGDQGHNGNFTNADNFTLL